MRLQRRDHRLTSRIETFAKPLIVAVNGLAHAAGCEITEAAPLAIASERAEFYKAEISLGFAPRSVARRAVAAARRPEARAVHDPDGSSDPRSNGRIYGLVNIVAP